MTALRDTGQRVRDASRALLQASDEQRSQVLRRVAELLDARSASLITHNGVDVAAYDGAPTGRDRLVLTPERIAGMSAALREIADLPDPLFEVLEPTARPNGLRVEKMRVPLGVVGVVYENRPNVTCDVAALCLKSGNAAFLRGSASALSTNRFLVGLWHEALAECELPVHSVTLVDDPSHDTVREFMQLTGIIDCLIPRGGPSLIAAMREFARVPYVIDGDGNCHVFVDESADLEMALRIVVNAKMSRPGVCNAAETVLVHRAIAPTFLPRLVEALPGVDIRGDVRAQALVGGITPATEEDFEREFLDLIVALKVVDSLDEALAHVATYGTGHSEAIVTQSDGNAQTWVRSVDAAAVVVNASTRFVDGGELGLGAEIGISTQKLHARGPMGLKELTCLKWVVRGEGQIR